MGGTGSGRKISFKTNLVLYALDVQLAVTSLMDKINNENATFDEVKDELVKLNREARRICQENERL